MTPEELVSKVRALLLQAGNDRLLAIIDANRATMMGVAKVAIDKRGLALTKREYLAVMEHVKDLESSPDWGNKQGRLATVREGVKYAWYVSTGAGGKYAKMARKILDRDPTLEPPPGYIGDAPGGSVGDLLQDIYENVDPHDRLDHVRIAWAVERAFGRASLGDDASVKDIYTNAPFDYDLGQTLELERFRFDGQDWRHVATTSYGQAERYMSGNYRVSGTDPRGVDGGEAMNLKPSTPLEDERDSIKANFEFVLDSFGDLEWEWVPGQKRLASLTDAAGHLGSIQWTGGVFRIRPVGKDPLTAKTVSDVKAWLVDNIRSTPLDGDLWDQIDAAAVGMEPEPERVGSSATLQSIEILKGRIPEIVGDYDLNVYSGHSGATLGARSITIDWYRLKPGERAPGGIKQNAPGFRLWISSADKPGAAWKDGQDPVGKVTVQRLGVHGDWPGGLPKFRKYTPRKEGHQALNDAVNKVLKWFQENADALKGTGASDDDEAAAEAGADDPNRWTHQKYLMGLLNLIRGYKSSYRAEEMANYGYGQYTPSNPWIADLISAGYLKTNKAGNIILTKAGRNADTERLPYRGSPDWTPPPTLGDSGGVTIQDLGDALDVLKPDYTRSSVTQVLPKGVKLSDTAGGKTWRKLAFTVGGEPLHLIEYQTKRWAGKPVESFHDALQRLVEDVLMATGKLEIVGKR